ncbi:MAG TPA: beta-N-acetylglucosaminidase domain-containing protein [Cellvibrio sp.]|nr:beta-N-acetylglucosaminidase domain-containing protein [Cellvibrio sp.]
MSQLQTPPLGIIEGFFGRSWSWEDRRRYAKFLALNEFNFYIYAPKSDLFLRRQWQEDWPQAIKRELSQTRDIYRQEKIDFGIGLSPYEIYLADSRDNRSALRKRIQQINQLAPDILCLLFDDMRGDLPDLARIQIDLMHEVAELSMAKRIIFCPTYYSFDPVLEKVFGKMPENYWQSLQQSLDKNIDIFWTGEKVCSTNYSSTHLQQVSELLGRKPFLWDNYPVNDGAVKSKLLHLRAVEIGHAGLQQQVSGHALNPMNQPWLSQIALASLPRAYREQQAYNSQVALTEICTALCGAELAENLLHDIPLLQDKGLDKLSAEEKQDLSAGYSRFTGNPFADELLDWLRGGYAFDPACLTE